MEVFGKSALSEFLGDFVVFRNLVPMDKRLPSLDEIRDEIELSGGSVPRKSEPEYARVIVHLLRQSQILITPHAHIKRLIYIGDTRLNDGKAFANMCQTGELPGVAFIGSENNKPPQVMIEETETGLPLYLANRWRALADFTNFCTQEGFPIDRETAIIIDLDKTALGARGRNSHVIDQARVQAVRNTVADLLGDSFNEAAFQVAYDHLNQAEYHSFTTDNQDYLAYICLIVSSGLIVFKTLVNDIHAGRLWSFKHFIAQIDDLSDLLQPELEKVHKAIYANVLMGDPTPFKEFRFNEYLTTVKRMGQLDEKATVKSLLDSEIVITQEVRAVAINWKEQGALLFGLSDKPDEASIPTTELMTQGYLPLHLIETHVVGEVC